MIRVRAYGRPYLERRGTGCTLAKDPMLTDVAIVFAVFVAGYALRAWISMRRRNAVRKARGR